MTVVIENNDTAGDRLVNAAHNLLGLCDGGECGHYDIDRDGVQTLSPLGLQAAQILLDAFYGFEARP